MTATKHGTHAAMESAPDAAGEGTISLAGGVAMGTGVMIGAGSENSNIFS